MDEDGAAGYEWAGFAEGLRGAFCLAGLVMGCSFVGFGALVKSLNFGLLPAFATIAFIWALPGQVVFADMWAKGAGLSVIALAVTVTAVRLLPMAVLVLSKARLKGAPRWPEFVVAHFTAVTIWLLTNQKIDVIARRRRLPWMLGLGSALMTGMFAFTALGYLLAEGLPPVLARTLVFFTPAFFLVTLLSGARWRFDYWAIGLGLVIGPVASHYWPRFDLLIAGLAGGTAAFLIARPKRRGLLK
jgi:predicted branched-subunit amino acid permease